VKLRRTTIALATAVSRTVIYRGTDTVTVFVASLPAASVHTTVMV
jgi:hypothetical protein